MTTVSRRANTTHKITVMIVKFAPRMVKCQIKKSGCDFRLKFRLLVDEKSFVCLYLPRKKIRLLFFTKKYNVKDKYNLAFFAQQKYIFKNSMSIRSWQIHFKFRAFLSCQIYQFSIQFPEICWHNKRICETRMIRTEYLVNFEFDLGCGEEAGIC